MNQKQKNIFPRLCTAMETKCEMNAQIARGQAEHLLETMPEELFPNLEEWIAGVPISDLRVGKYSILMIMKMRKMSEERHFPIAAEMMSVYIRNPRAGERRIWHPWR